MFAVLQETNYNPWNYSALKLTLQVREWEDYFYNPWHLALRILKITCYNRGTPLFLVELLNFGPRKKSSCLYLVVAVAILVVLIWSLQSAGKGGCWEIGCSSENLWVRNQSHIINLLEWFVWYLYCSQCTCNLLHSTKKLKSSLFSSVIYSPTTRTPGGALGYLSTNVEMNNSWLIYTEPWDFCEVSPDG